MNYQGISVICQGDTTTTGGRVLEGVLGNHYTCDGIPVALKGHKVSCPACGKIGVIAEGEVIMVYQRHLTAIVWRAVVRLVAIVLLRAVNRSRLPHPYLRAQC
ncbi:PAAR domain-containing protein [Serratia silvae]|uniref:PAAR domain-containing protein n=1 Tax=Serratia silvae TaxID=2824122 RepID=UPI00201074A2|nr:PAAR domain-containing protein [Serratia silvae]